MRMKGASIQQFLLGMALLAAVCWNLAHAGELRGLHLSSGPTGTRAELRMDSEARYQLIPLANPDRLVVDLPGSSARRGLQLPAASGVVRGVRSGRPSPGTTRIVFDLAGSVMTLKPHYESGADGPRLVLEWPDDGTQTSVSAEPQSAPALSTAEASIPNPPDAELTSVAATSRLVASLPVSQARPRDPLPAVPRVDVPPSESVPTRIATGIPTHVATGEPAPPQQSSIAPLPSYPHTAVKTMQDVMRRGGLRPLIIAIDPGHGGQDPGARGSRRQPRKNDHPGDRP